MLDRLRWPSEAAVHPRCLSHKVLKTKAEVALRRLLHPDPGAMLNVYDGLPRSLEIPPRPAKVFKTKGRSLGYFVFLDSTQDPARGRTFHFFYLHDRRYHPLETGARQVAALPFPCIHSIARVKWLWEKSP
jgi:hypothetical protein